MEEEGERRVRAKRSDDEVDRLTNLPDKLLCKILLNLPTKDVVKTSVLSKRWGDLWPLVPGLDLACADFQDRNAFVTFVDRFLGFGKSCLQDFTLALWCKWKWDEGDTAHVTRWIDAVLKREVQQFHLLESLMEEVGKEVEIPLRFYMCESLVTLTLWDAILPDPKSVSLPSLKSMDLVFVRFANDGAFEMFISGCPVLESLTIWRSEFDNVKELRVCSQSLLSFSHFGQSEDHDDKDQVVVIDAPRLEYLMLYGATDSFIIKTLVSLVEADIKITFNISQFDPNDLPKRNMIRDFLLAISQVEDMTIASTTLEVIYNFSRCEKLPLFGNMSSLRVDFSDYRWEMLPIFLESCPNLNSLTLGFSKFPGDEEGVSILPGPRRFLTSLEYVEILKPIAEEAIELNLVSYILENSTILKEFTYCFSDSRKKEKNEVDVILKKLLAIPRLSSSCQVSVL